MSQFVTYIPLEPFVRQWLTNSFGDPVVFPAQSIENATIRRFTVKQPNTPEKKSDKDIAIAIPDSKAKDPMIYNHLGQHGKMAVAECIEDTFRRNMWAELNDLSDVGCSVMKAIYSWCEMHGIDIEYAWTIRQRYYRLRDSYKKNGIDLRKRKRFRDDE
jgi:hypothetical protein